MPSRHFLNCGPATARRFSTNVRTPPRQSLEHYTTSFRSVFVHSNPVCERTSGDPRTLRTALTRAPSSGRSISKKARRRMGRGAQPLRAPKSASVSVGAHESAAIGKNRAVATPITTEKCQDAFRQVRVPTNNVDRCGLGMDVKQYDARISCQFKFFFVTFHFIFKSGTNIS